jgi:hypothetical protein
MKLIPNAGAAWRLWSVRLAAAGTAVATLGAFWTDLPPEVRAMVPAGPARWIDAALFAAAIVARVVQQRAPEARDGE